MMWHLQDQDTVRKGEFNWLGFDWGRRGGLQARELALWVQLQREFRRRNLLGTDAIKRLEAIGFNWEPEVSHACCCLQGRCIMLLLHVKLLIIGTPCTPSQNGHSAHHHLNPVEYVLPC